MKELYNLIFPLSSMITITGLFLYFVILKAQKQFVLYKFTKQNDNNFFNKKAFWLCIFSLVITLIILVIAFITIGVLFFINFKNKLAVSSAITVIYLFVLIVAYWIWKIYASSILFIIKNNQIVIEDEVIDFESIHAISNNVRRNKILIHYVNNEKEGKIITIKYNWELKDLIIKNGINSNFI